MGVESGLRQLQGKGRGLGVDLPSEQSLDVWKAGPGVMLPPKHPDSLDTGISGAWGLTSNQTNRLSDTGLSGDPNSSFLSPDSEE